MIACYDLRVQLPTFDFYQWLVMRAAEGASEIVFDASGYRESIWSPEQLRRRFETIIAPGPALLGLPSREGTDGARVGTVKLKHFVEFVRSRRAFPRLKSVLPPRKVKYTVTLRQQSRKSPYRNSQIRDWRTFAAEIGAIVIEDYDVTPIHLHERMALYAGAEMNFGVASGPMFLATLTPYPTMVFNWGCGVQREFLTGKVGLAYDQPLPWCQDNQVNVWQRDDLSTIRSSFNAWLRRGG